MWRGINETNEPVARKSLFFVREVREVIIEGQAHEGETGKGTHVCCIHPRYDGGNLSHNPENISFPERANTTFLLRVSSRLQFHNVLSVIRAMAQNWGVYTPRLRSFVILYFLRRVSLISVKVTLAKRRLRNHGRSCVMSCFLPSNFRTTRSQLILLRRILICNISRDSILILIDSSANIELSFFIKMNEVSSLKYLKNLIKIMMIYYRNSRKSIHGTGTFYI